MAGYLQGRGVYVDKHLSNIALNYRPQGFIADRVFPVATVQKQSGMIKTYNQADLFRRETTYRSAGAEANRISFQVGSDSYNAINYALRADVTIEDRVNADPAFVTDLEAGRVMRVMDALAIDWEVRVATQATNTSNVGTSSAVSSAWTDYSNSTPLRDVETMMDNVEGITAYRPNKIVMGLEAWRNFSRNDQVIDKVQATGVTGAGQNANIGQAGNLLGVDEVLVGNGYYNTAEEGQPQVLTPIWGDSVLVYYAPSRPSIELPSFGYSLRWAGGGLPNMQVERHPFDRNTKTDGIEIGYYQDEKILASTLGALITNVTSST